MHSKRLTATLATVALVSTLGLAACDRARTGANEPPTTVGQKIDKAIDRTQQKIQEAGDKTAQKLTEASDKTMQTLSDAGQKTEQALSTAGDKIAATTNEAVTAVKDSTASVTVPSTGEASRAMSDAAITASIKTDYLKDPDLSVLKIDVDTKAGVVTLNGLTGTEPARQRAEKMASAIKGVKEVRNFLVVKRA
jgi:osmotically-inducible protein OsmY